MSRAKGPLRAPTKYGSDAQRTSDYGDLIKGLLECQPIRLRSSRPGESWRAAESSINGTACRVRTRGAHHPDAEKSMIARPAHTTRAALRLGVTPLRRDQVELLLCLIEAETDALLVEQPEVAPDGCVDEP